MQALLHEPDRPAKVYCVFAFCYTGMMLGNLFSKKTPVQIRDIKLYNTASKQLETFIPSNPRSVKMYTCGPTVYDYVHIGNLRSFLTADIVKRVLLRNGFEVDHTINLTDFGHLSDDGDMGEDKMMKSLKREGLPITLDAMTQLSTKYIKAFQDDIAEMRILEPTTWARASTYVKQQISLIKTLEEKGYTYETSDGVYFDIKRFADYGKLGNLSHKQLKSGARVSVNQEKRQPADFAVWKKSHLGWKSRWGTGFPGWHIECSAMALTTLGKEIDIHTGGEDLQYTHHNAEIAQSEAATGKPFVKYWIHNAFINIDNGAKISKSKGNAVNLRQLIDAGYSGDDYRYWLLTSHYRSPVTFSWDALKAAKQTLFRLKRHMYEEFKQKSTVPDTDYLELFDNHLANDFDTPAAIATLWDMLKDSRLSNETKCGTLMAMDEVLDIGLTDPLAEGVRSLGVLSTDEIPPEIKQLVDQREVARIAQNWLEADNLRDQIKLRGYQVEDSAVGPKITKAE
jgi:cysteinyl-tRNA synthetase